jgi:predicted transcriptional regulator
VSLALFCSNGKEINAMKTNLTLKVEQSQQKELSAFAQSLNMSRSKLVLTAINEFVQKQNPQAS